MVELNDQQMKKISGGFKKSFFISAAAIVTFLIGLFDGYKPQSYTN